MTQDRLAFVSVAFDLEWPGDSFFVVQDKDDVIVPGTAFSGDELTDALKTYGTLFMGFPYWIHQETSSFSRIANEAFDWVELRFGVAIDRNFTQFAQGVPMASTMGLLENIGNHSIRYTSTAAPAHGRSAVGDIAPPAYIRGVSFGYTEDGTSGSPETTALARQEVVYVRELRSAHADKTIRSRKPLPRPRVRGMSARK